MAYYPSYSEVVYVEPTYTVPQAVRPAPAAEPAPPTPTEAGRPEIDFESVAKSLAEALAEDPRFRGPPGEPGAPGKPGAPGPAGPQGPAGKDADQELVTAIQEQLVIVQQELQNQKVLLEQHARELQEVLIFVDQFGQERTLSQIYSEGNRVRINFILGDP
jgi:hypothetical protein